MRQKIVIIDFGSQFTQIIARRVREMSVYCEIVSYDKLRPFDASVSGIILSGAGVEMGKKELPQLDSSLFKEQLPTLGICYGAQFLVRQSGGNASTYEPREYGSETIVINDSNDPLFRDIPTKTTFWRPRKDAIEQLPRGYQTVAEGENGEIAAYKIDGRQSWGVMFHPEVYQSQQGMQMLKNFVITICGCEQSWTPAVFASDMIEELKEQIGNDKVLLALSGGVDSTVAATLLHRAIGSNLTCIFVNHGLLRKDEFSSVLESYKHMGLNITGVDASAKFIGDLKGVTDPEQKRKIIGRDFIEVFDEQAQKLNGITWLAQGTIYPDIIESISTDGSVAVKSHHNVGGLPEKMNLKIVEPLRLLFKDDVRRVGRELGIAESLLGRHPFPGPGLGIRVLGEVTAEKVAVLQEADKIYTDMLREFGLYDKIWQAAAILLPVQSVGVTNDVRTYENCLALRAVNSVDGMTADWVDLPHDFLVKVSNDIIKNVVGINRVVYDISSKPPATIEWE